MLGIVVLVVVGGGVTKSWDLMAASIEATLAVDAPVSGVPLEIRQARLGPHAVALGAAAAARAHVLPLPDMVTVG